MDAEAKKDYWFEIINGEKFLCFTKRKNRRKVVIKTPIKQLIAEAGN